MEVVREREWSVVEGEGGASVAVGGQIPGGHNIN